jgi:hypothetical protein
MGADSPLQSKEKHWAKKLQGLRLHVIGTGLEENEAEAAQVGRFSAAFMSVSFLFFSFFVPISFLFGRFVVLFIFDTCIYLSLLFTLLPAGAAPPDERANLGH